MSAVGRWNTASVRGGSEVSDLFRRINYSKRRAIERKKVAWKKSRRAPDEDKNEVELNQPSERGSLFLKTGRAPEAERSVMEKCARERAEVVPLSSWSLKKSRAAHAARSFAREERFENLKKFERGLPEKGSLLMAERREGKGLRLTSTPSLGTNYVNSVRPPWILLREREWKKSWRILSKSERRAKTRERSLRDMR